MSSVSPWNETRRACLRAFCDTLFPRLQFSADPHGFWNRAASDFGVDAALLESLEMHAPAQSRLGALRLLDVLASLGFCAAEQAQRERTLHAVMNSSPDAAAGLQALI